MRYSLALLTALCACNPVSKPYKVEKNLPYGDHPRQVFDYYEPPYDTGRSLRPAVLAIHGGGWSSGDKDWGEEVAAELCPRGYVVFAINYRLSGDAQWPAQLDDCEQAYGFVREQAWAHVDADRIAAFGVSAGGHLASMLHLRGDVPFAISAAAPFDLVNDRSLDVYVGPLFGLAPGDVAPIDSLTDVSPVSFVKPEAEMLLLHATGDPIVSFDQADVMHQALLLENADVTLLTDHGAEHGRGWYGEINGIVRWLEARQGPARGPNTFAGLEHDLRVLPR